MPRWAGPDRGGFVRDHHCRAFGRIGRTKRGAKSMHYFVTGATGFIGRRLVRKLLERKGSVDHILIRRESADKVAGLREYWGVAAQRAVPVYGDRTQKRLGVAADDIKALKGEVAHFYHLAAVYD